MPQPPKLHQHRTALLATHGFEELELIEPLRALREEGAEVDIIALDPDPIQAMHRHHKTNVFNPDRVLGSTVLPEQYDSLILPGGSINAHALSASPLALRFVNAIHEAEKPIAAIGHAARILISAGVASNRKITGFPTLKDDASNAGALWSDEPVVIHDNLITARDAHSLAAFNSAVIEMLSRRPVLISPETRRLLARSRIA